MVDKNWDEEITPPPWFPRAPGLSPSGEQPGQPGPPGKSTRVLLIEDNPGDSRLVRELLAEVGGTAFGLETAERLTAGLSRLARGDIDVVLLDLSLPDSKGLETFLRVHTLAPRVPVVLLSGLDDETLAILAVQKGAEDYLVKGHMDAGVLVRSIRYAIERTRRRHAEQALRATAMKLHMARQIQQKLFPAAAPALPGYDIGGGSFCAEATGGDYFDYLPMVDKGVGIVIADVSGHGFGPALLMASTRAYLRALAQTHRSVGDILTLANRFLTDEVGEDSFVTLLLARLEPQARSLVYVSAGHPTGYVLDAAGAVKSLLESSGFPLGVEPDGVYVDVPAVPLDPGDIVVFLTDGIMETRSTADCCFGLERALDVVRAHRARPAQEIITELYRAVRDFCRDRAPVDDVTAIVIKVAEA
jgi:phosphoserine phosphatase RsbU/P